MSIALIQDNPELVEILEKINADIDDEKYSKNQLKTKKLIINDKVLLTEYLTFHKGLGERYTYSWFIFRNFVYYYIKNNGVINEQLYSPDVVRALRATVIYLKGLKLKPDYFY